MRRERVSTSRKADLFMSSLSVLSAPSSCLPRAVYYYSVDSYAIGRGVVSKAFPLISAVGMRDFSFGSDEEMTLDPGERTAQRFKSELNPRLFVSSVYIYVQYVYRYRREKKNATPLSINKGSLPSTESRSPVFYSSERGQGH